MDLLDTTCPHCGKKNDCHDSAQNDEQARPEPGDLSMCIGCGEFARFDDNMALKKFTPEERAMIMADDEAMMHMAKATMAWRMLKAQEAAEKHGVTIIDFEPKRPNGPT